MSDFCRTVSIFLFLLTCTSVKSVQAQVLDCRGQGMAKTQDDLKEVKLEVVMIASDFNIYKSISIFRNVYSLGGYKFTAQQGDGVINLDNQNYFLSLVGNSYVGRHFEMREAKYSNQSDEFIFDYHEAAYTKLSEADILEVDARLTCSFQ